MQRAKISIIVASSLVALIPGASLEAQRFPPEVWLGAPFDGAWPSDSGCAVGASNECSLPYKHWIAYGGQWSVDLPAPRGSDVFLFVAPEKGGEVITKVESIREACQEGRKGGKVVRIGVYFGGHKIGHLAYSHLVPTVKVGEVKRWGEKLGTLFSTTETHPKCWMGSHLHLEVASSSGGFACYNKGFRPGQRFKQTNFLGFVAGRKISGERTACP